MAEKCSSCEQMLKENKVCRKAMMDTNKQFVDVCNENLTLRRQIEKLEAQRATVRTHKLEALQSPFYGMPLCSHGYQFDCQACQYEKEKGV